MNNELLKEAKERYPSGAHFICAFDSDDEAVVSGDFDVDKDGDIYCMNEAFRVFVRSNGEWAKIIKEPKPKCKTLNPDEKIVEYALELNGVDFNGMSEEEQAKISNTFKWLQSYVNGCQNKIEDTECSHDWSKPHINSEVKQCRKCGLYERRG